MYYCCWHCRCSAVISSILWSCWINQYVSPKASVHHCYWEQTYKILPVLKVGNGLLIKVVLSGKWSGCRSQWPHGLRRRSSAACLLRLRVRIPPEAWMFVCCECCVLSGRGLCNGLITHPEESYRLWRVMCDQETSKMRRLKPAIGLWKYNHNGL